LRSEEEFMSSHANIRRSLAIAALVLVAGTSLVSMAEASHRRYRGAYGERVTVRRVARTVVARRVVPRGSYAVWHSGSGPVVAGFLSGLFLGATLTHAAPQGFVYWDPYCHEGFASLEAYDVHCSRHRHASVIQVVEADPGCDPDVGHVTGDPGSYDDGR
jgi:hypothetical protein